MGPRVCMATIALLAVGCVQGPNYKRPATTPAADGWRDTSQALRDASFANLPWWNVLGDSVLQSLVRQALAENRDVRIAFARVNESRALLGIQRLEAYPQIEIPAGVRRSNGSDSLLTGSGSRSVAFLGPTVAWEADMWGRLRRLNESALSNLLATEHARRAVIMTVVSEVARAYLELRDLDNQVAIADSQVTIRRQSLDLARARYQGGLTSELDVRQGENNLAIAQGILARALRESTQKENELSVLLGRPPRDVPRGLTLAQQPFPDIVPAGLPSTLLERRPDIRAAEEQLHSANARIGAAIAALFPAISLTGAGGSASDGLDNVFGAGTAYTRIAANLLQPVLEHSRNRKQVQAERARTEEAVGSYEKTVLTAFQEVEDGLVAVRRLREESQAAGRAAAAARLAVTLATARYEGGVDTYLNLLDAQRSQLNAELLESQVRRHYRVAMVQLYKALGGGWDPATDRLTLPGGAPR